MICVYCKKECIPREMVDVNDRKVCDDCFRRVYEKVTK